MVEKGRKDDNGKLPWWLLPMSSVREVLKVLKWAAYEKQPVPYGPNNWQYVEEAPQRYYDAAMRHLTDWWELRQNGGSRADHESGFHILAHAACCVLFLLWFELNPVQAAQAQRKDKNKPELCPRCGKTADVHDFTITSKWPVCPVEPA